MNIEEAEEALRTINGHLITDKELQFVYQVSNNPRVYADLSFETK